MTVFDRDSFRDALTLGVCDPPKRLTPLVDVCRSSYARMQAKTKKTVHDHYDKLVERMPAKTFGQVRMAADRALRCASQYFPAYQFHVGEFINEEWLSTVDWDGHRNFHRDHVLHQLLCVYTGMTILKGGSANELLFNGRPLIDWCLDAVLFAPECAYLRDVLKGMGAPRIYFRGDALSRLLWTDIVLESFFLAANYHDIGYPWQFVSKIHNKLSPNVPSFRPQNEGVDGLYEHYKNRLVLFPLRGYQPCSSTLPTVWTIRSKAAMAVALSGTHGFPGALAMLHLNDCMRVYPVDSRDFAVSRFCIEWAATAIMMHDMQKLYAEGGDGCDPMKHLRVSINRDPLSFLMTLVDQIQDFGRANGKFNRNPSTGKVDLEYPVACHKVKISRPDDRASDLLLEYLYNDENIAKENYRFKKGDGRIVGDEEKFFDPTTGFIDYSGLGVSRIRMDVKYERGGKW